MTLLITSLGWIGSGLMILAYYLVSAQKIESSNPKYQLLNLFGALGLGIHVFHQEAWAALALELIWGAIAFVAFMKNKTKKPKTAEEFDTYFEKHDIADLLDTRTFRVNIDFPASVVSRLDLQANQLGMSRQSLVKYWIAERLNLVPKGN